MRFNVARDLRIITENELFSIDFVSSTRDYFEGNSAKSFIQIKKVGYELVFL